MDESTPLSDENVIKTDTKIKRNEKKVDLSFQEFKKYAQYKVFAPTMSAFVFGATRGYYLGDLAIPYAYTYGLGMTFGATLFYCGTYLLSNIRGEDDLVNHASSGLVTGGWLSMVLLKSHKSVLIGAGVGTVIGGMYKLTGDWFYDTTRNQWLKSQKYSLDNPKKPMGMLYTKPKF